VKPQKGADVGATTRGPQRPRRRWHYLLAALFLLFALGLRLAFPGPRLGMAFTLSTGIGTAGLQARIDALEEQAINARAFSAEDRAFLSDFYRTLATGAKLSILVRQTGSMMDHYLDGSGAEYRLSPEIFRGNRKVQAQLGVLRRRAAGKSCVGVTRVASPTFYMPDPSQVDSVFGLYHGSVALTRAPGTDGKCVSHVRAEVPWNWPTYASLKQKYGSYHSESFPLPNQKSLVLGRKHSLFVDNGLGEYLVQLGLAKSFLAFAEWDE
jgi:hypothetical protein